MLSGSPVGTGGLLITGVIGVVDTVDQTLTTNRAKLGHPTDNAGLVPVVAERKRNARVNEAFTHP